MPVQSQPAERVADFYTDYHGHNLDKLGLVHSKLRGDPNNPRPCVFLAGDSSFDNKFWFSDTATAINGFENVLDPPQMKKDIAYWLNYESYKQGKNWFCLNCAVEESALVDRSQGTRLLPQDEFIRDHIRPEDTLIVSVGGNDIALKITRETAQNILDLMQPESLAWLDRARKDACGHHDENSSGGFCEECLSGNKPPLSVSYFIDLFKTQVELYVDSLIKKQKPKRVVICMIYYPLESGSGSSWADRALDQLKYNETPQLLQMLIRTFHEVATKRVKIEGTEVIACPLFSILDGKNERDYVSRVEPSAAGGAKIGRALASSFISDDEKSSDVATTS